MLLTVHGLNLPLAAAGHLLSPRKLDLSDLWRVVAFSLSYLAFYLSYMDRKGNHFYIILSPRAWWSPVVYGGMMLLCGGALRCWNWAGSRPLGARQALLD